MSARIIGINHTVTSYLFNGKKQYIVDELPKTCNRDIVNAAIEECNSRERVVVYKHIDEWLGVPETDKGLIRAIEQLTY